MSKAAHAARPFAVSAWDPTLLRDRLLALVLIALGIGAPTWLNHLSPEPNSASGTPGAEAGSLVPTGGEVRVRHGGSVIWGKVATSSPVLWRDSISTANDSTATLTLDGQDGAFEILPDSLLSLRQADTSSASVLHLESGAVLLSLAKPLTLEAGSRRYELSPEHRGQHAGTSIRIERRAGASAPKLVVLDSGSGSVWVRETSGKSVEHYRLRPSRTADHPSSAPPPSRAPVPEVGALPPLARLPAPAKHVARAKSFSVVQAPPPPEVEILLARHRIMRTHDPATFRLARAPSEYAEGVVLRWKPVKDAGAYDIAFQGIPGSVETHATSALPELSVLLPSGSSGNLRYRVSSRSAAGTKSASAWVPVRTEVSRPETTSPKDGVTVKTGSPVLLTWERGSLASEEYEVAVSRAPDFGSATVIRTVRRNFMSFAPSTTGKYYWRVRILTNGHQSDWSLVHTLVESP